MRVAEAGARLAQDAAFRAEWIESRAHTAEEAARSLAAAARAALASRAAEEAPALSARRPGAFLDRAAPEAESVVAGAGRGPRSPRRGRRARRRAHGPRSPTLMSDLLRRRTSIRSVRRLDRVGDGAAQPLVRPRPPARRESAEKLERFRLDRAVGFPEAPPASGDDAALWTGTFVWLRPRPPPRGWCTCSSRCATPRAGSRAASRSRSTRGATSTEAMETLGAGRRLLVRARRRRARAADDAARRREPRLERDRRRAARRRRRPGAQAAGAAGAADPAVQRSVRAGRPPGAHRDRARRRPREWVFGEGLSEQALDTIRGEAARVLPVATYAGLRRDVILLFLVLLPAVLVAIGNRVAARLGARLGAGPRGRGDRARPVGRGGGQATRRTSSAGSRPRSTRWASRVERRVETLRRLHDFSRSAYRMTDPQEVLARATQAVAGFTARRARLVLLLRPQHEPARGAAAGLERHRGDGGAAAGVARRAIDRGDGLPHRRAVLQQRPRPRPLREPRRSSRRAGRATACSRRSRPRRRRSASPSRSTATRGSSRRRWTRSPRSRTSPPCCSATPASTARSPEPWTSCGARAVSRTTSSRTSTTSCARP